MASIRLVVTNGCSFTYGTDLSDRGRCCWGRQVADALGADFVNLAAGGGSNRRLVRTTVEQLPAIAERYGCSPTEVLFLGMWSELPRWEVYDPDDPDAVALAESFQDRAWHRIGLWHLDRKYRPALAYYRHLQHDEGDLLDLLLGYSLLESFLRDNGYRYGFMLVEDLLPPDLTAGRYDNLLRHIDARRLLGGWRDCGELSFLSVVERRGLPMSGRPPRHKRRNGHPLEEAHATYAREYVLPFVHGLIKGGHEADSG
jgi:hypothetical protein